MPTAMYAHLTYDLAHLVADHLTRSEKIETRGYYVDTRHRFPECRYCDTDPQLAVLTWDWNSGSGECCTNSECVKAVLEEGLEAVTDVSEILCEYPMVMTRTARVLQVAA